MARVGKTKINTGNRGLGRTPLSFKMDTGWKKYNNATDRKRFVRKFARHRKRALDQVARTIIKQAIDRGSFAPNAPLTKAIKGKSTPLDDTGNNLNEAFRTIMVRGGKELFVGIPTTHAFYKTAVRLHEGETLKVTKKMREMFVLLWLASNGEIGSDQLTGRAAELFKRKSDGWLPLRDSTTAIRIPARPFIAEAFGSDQTRQAALAMFTAAVDRTLVELSYDRS